MIPASLQKVLAGRRSLEQRHVARDSDVTTIWRHGSMIIERGDGRVQRSNITALPPSFPATDENPFPHD